MCFRRAYPFEIKSWKEDSWDAVDDLTPVFAPRDLLWFQTLDEDGQGRSCGPWQHVVSRVHDKEIEK